MTNNKTEDYMNYFHDAEFTIPNTDITVKEKGRLYKNVFRDGSLSNFEYEVKYYINGEQIPGFPVGDFFIDFHFPFSDPTWACASPDELVEQ